MRNLAFALSAVILFASLAVLMFVHGNEVVKVMVLWSLLVGAISQFVAQDEAVAAQAVALYLSWLAILLTMATVVVATITFTVG